MRSVVKRLFCAALSPIIWSCFVPCCFGQEPAATPPVLREAAHVTPSPRQLAWQELEFICFAHFGINTFTDREWGDGREDPRLFHPSAFDADQWVAACKAAGMKLLILTCKHHDGFCLWPSRYTEHSVKSSPWRNGCGDVVRDVSDACRRGGIKFGVYLSPWDRHEKTYGSDAYNEYYKNQLRELLTQYGPIAEVWMDGACGEGPSGKRQVYDVDGYVNVARELQPNAVIAITGPDVRWVGNEDGLARESEWSVTPKPWPDFMRRDFGHRKYLAGAKHLIWYPAECDVSIRPGWFYHPGEDAKVKSVEELLDIHDRSVGRNAVLLLNVPPDRRGLFPENDVARLKELRAALDATFKTNMAARKTGRASSAAEGHEAAMAVDGDPATYWMPTDGEKKPSLEIDFGRTVTFDRAMLQEMIAEGQRVEKFKLESGDGQAWREFARATTIGHKRLLRFPAVTASKVRLTLLDARDTPTIREFGLFRSPVATHRVYSHLLDPREHPDYDRRAVKPPTWETFGNRTQFTSLRGFQLNQAGDRIVDYVKDLDLWTRRHNLGDVIWPGFQLLHAKNVGDLADEIKRRNLYLFDIWGYVPGSGAGGFWGKSLAQFKPSAEVLAMFESKLGDRWLGMDNGEQDGRYIGGYANQMTPASASRVEQYLSFQRHFEGLENDLGHKLAALVSLNFGHYFLKEGTYTLLGAETAQALPNSQVQYAFIRGAGKQYGVPWFGNASVFNRWAYKNYGPRIPGDCDYRNGPTEGTSLSLMKRLLYSHILYNSVAVGFENGQLLGDKLSPIGRIQQAAHRWTKEHGQPGVMHAPVALLLDFHAGWTYPRHLYTNDVYRVWGNLPYEAGDCLTDAVLDMLYPGYQNASYYHDESGFLAPTPYGDIADCLLSDAPAWLLARYPVVVVAGELAGGQEMRDKLQAYVDGGGCLAITQGNLDRLPGGLAARETKSHGTLTVLSDGFGVTIDENMPAASLRGGPHEPGSPFDRPLAKPYSLRPEVREKLDAIFRGQRLFSADADGLGLVTCRKSPGEYTVGVFNNSWREQPLKIVSHCGPIASIRELTLDQSERDAVGFLPKGVDGQSLGRNADATIAGGDVRIFAVRVRESGVEEIARVAPPPHPRGRVLPLRRVTSIKEEILARPTFFEHFDGVVVDWRYLHDREPAALKREAGWIRRQGLRVYVDLRSGLNLFPTLRLIDNIDADYAASMAAIADVLEKMTILGSHDLILRLHRYPENNCTGEQARAALEKTLRQLARQAARRDITLHVEAKANRLEPCVATVVALVAKVGEKNLRLAIGATPGMDKGEMKSDINVLKSRIGLWLLAGDAKDAAGRTWNLHVPLYRSDDLNPIKPWLNLKPDAPCIFDAVYEPQPLEGNHDEEYRDAIAIERLSGVP